MALSAVGTAVAIVVLITTLRGADPSDASPWLWHLTAVGLVMWGLMFLLPGAFVLLQKRSAESGDAAIRAVTAPAAKDKRARTVAHALNVLLLAIALANFAAVSKVRGDVTATTKRARVAEYAVSRRSTLRVMSGFWLVLFGVPTSAFYVIARELQMNEA